MNNVYMEIIIDRVGWGGVVWGWGGNRQSAGVLMRRNHIELKFKVQRK